MSSHCCKNDNTRVRDKKEVKGTKKKRKGQGPRCKLLMQVSVFFLLEVVMFLIKTVLKKYATKGLTRVNVEGKIYYDKENLGFLGKMLSRHYFTIGGSCKKIQNQFVRVFVN